MRSTKSDEYFPNGSGLRVCARLKPASKGEVQCLYSCEDENGQSIIACPTPPQQRLIQTSFRSENDVSRVVKEIFDCRVDVITVDSVFSAKSTQEIFYRKIAKQNGGLSGDIFDQKKHVAVLLYGPSRSGKSYTLAGDARHEKGLFFRSGEDLLSRVEVENAQNEIAELKLSIFAVHQNDIYDLLGGESTEHQELEIVEVSADDIRINGLSSTVIRARNDLKTSYSTALKRIQSLSETILSEKRLYETSHIVTQFSYTVNATTQKFTLVRLADTDYVDQSDDDFQILLEHLNHSQQSQQKCHHSKKLTAALADIFNPISSKITLIVCVTSSQNQFPQSLFALDYSQKIITNQRKQRLTSESESAYEQGHSYFVSPSNNQKSKVRQQLSSITSGQQAISPVQKNINSLIQTQNNQEYPMQQIQGQQRYGAQFQEKVATNNHNYNNETIIDFIITEIEGIYTEINQQTKAIQGLNEGEKLRWVEIKQQAISELKQQLSQQPYSRDVPYCETLISKCQRSLRLLGVGGSQNRQRNQNIPVSMQNSGISNASRVRSNSNEFQEFIREKDEKMDKDFLMLLNRYNHSKELIDSLGQTVGGGVASEYLGSPSRSVIINQSRSMEGDDMRKNINLGKKREDNVLILDNESDSNRDYYDDNDDENIGQGQNRNVGKNLLRLKETMEINELQAKKKMRELRLRNREMKVSLKGYVTKCEDFAQVVTEKDQEIERQEYELRQLQQDILLNLESLKEYKIKEENWAMMEIELRQNEVDLKGKLARKKKKMAAVRENAEQERLLSQERIRSSEEILQKYENELKSSQLKAQEENERTGNLNSNMAELRQEVEQKVQELNQFNQEMEEARGIYSQLREYYELEVAEKTSQLKQISDLTYANEQLSSNSQMLTKKIEKLRTKHAEQISVLTNDHLAALQSKKEKMRGLKSSNTQATAQLQETESKRAALAKTVEELSEKAIETQYELNEGIQQQQNLNQIIQTIQEEKDKMMLEEERLQNLVTALEKRNEQLEAAQLADAKTLNDMTSEVERMASELAQRGDLLNSAHEYIQQIKAQNESVLTQFEVKLEDVIDTLQRVSEENAQLKSREGENKKVLVQQEEQIEIYKEKYLKVKHANKSLISEKDLLEKKLSEALYERQIERTALEREREKKERFDNSQKNKRRVIDEIQSMIQSHKNLTFSGNN